MATASTDEAKALPPVLLRVSEALAKYCKVQGSGASQFFGRPFLPYSRGSEEFWWYLLLCTKPHRSIYATEGGAQPLISGPDVNTSQTPKEECELSREAIAKAGFNVDFIFGDGPERGLTVIQLDPSNNFLDRKVYKRIDSIAEHKFMKYCMEGSLVPREVEIPRFLKYNLMMYTNSNLRIDLVKYNDKLRNQPATLLTLPQKTLTPEMNIFGKAFVVCDDLDLTTEEMREIVIFCMGQAECLELKMKSWDKLRDILQDEARKFALNAEHLRR